MLFEVHPHFFAHNPSPPSYSLLSNPTGINPANSKLSKYTEIPEFGISYVLDSIHQKNDGKDDVSHHKKIRNAVFIVIADCIKTNQWFVI